MSGFLLFLILSLVTPGTTGSQHRDSIPDRQLLEMAVDYFASGKYHEALVLFIKLDKKYKLNPRFIAYTGVCYYHEQDYAAACRYLDKAIPSLDIYSPAERVVYYNAAADSHFRLEEYAAAIPLYEMLTLVCRKAEKADVLYRLGFCYMQQEKWAQAAETFASSAEYYKAFTPTGSKARVRQLDNIIKGCLQKVAN